MENSKRGYHIFVSWKNSKPAKQIQQELQVAKGSNTVSLASIYCWIEAFESGKNNVEDDSHSGCPQETSTLENIAKVDDLISDGPHMTITAIEENVGIYKGSIQSILHNELKVHKICKKWVPCVLTVGNKKNRVENSISR